jgi:phage-related minor tail protein
MSNATTAKRDAMNEADKARDSASGAVDKAKDAASGVMDKAKDAASHAGQAVSSAASAVGHKVDDTAGSVGSGMKNLGSQVREQGPNKGILGQATSAVAGALDSAGGYLEDKKLSGMGQDLTEMIKRNPIPALFLGVGLGFLLASTLRR